MPLYKVTWTQDVHVMINAADSEDAYRKWTDKNHDDPILDSEELDGIRLANEDDE